MTLYAPLRDQTHDPADRAQGPDFLRDLRMEGDRLKLLALFALLDLPVAISVMIHALSTPGPRLIKGDCPRYNFCAMLGIRNPYAPTIEWQKHQTPGVGARLLRGAGFVNPEIRWSSFNIMGKERRSIMENKVMTYLTRSHFLLTMEKPQMNRKPKAGKEAKK